MHLNLPQNWIKNIDNTLPLLKEDGMHEILVFDVSLPESLHDWCLTTNHEVIQKNGISVIEPNTVKEVTVYSMYE